MPNWCECTLEVSGEMKNVRRFLLEAFVCSKQGMFCLAYGDAHHLAIALPRIHDESSFYMKGSNRNYVNCREITWNFNDPTLVIHKYMVPWCVDLEYMMGISEEFQVVLKIFGHEETGAFEFDVEIDKGTMIKSDLVEYDEHENMADDFKEDDFDF